MSQTTRSLLLIGSYLIGGLAISLQAPARAQQSAAEAQAASQPQVDEVIYVTARRREEPLQETPIAVTAISDEQLENQNVVEISEITNSTPNLKFDAVATTSAASRVYIRGVGQDDQVNTSDPGVGLYVDGVYLSRSQGALFSLLDTERVEVLRGPQGTLYGRNTIGGAINVVTAKPGSDFGGNAVLRGGNFDLLEGRAAFGGPLSDNFSARIAAIYGDQEGYMDNAFDGTTRGDRELTAGRLSLRSGSDDGFSAVLTLDVSEDNRTPLLGNCSFQQATPLSGIGDLFGFTDLCRATELDGDPFLGASDFGDFEDVSTFGGVLTMAWVNSNSTWKSITAYRDNEFEIEIDADANPAPILDQIGLNDFSQVSQELTYQRSSDTADYTFGLYYFQEEADTTEETFALPLFPLAGFIPGINALNTNATRSVDNDNLAAFGQANWNLGERFTLTLGARYTDETKEIDFFSQSRLNGQILGDAVSELDFQEFTGLLSLGYEFTDRTFGYASYSRGFKSGGFNGRPVTDPGTVDTFEPEFVNAFELGLKTSSASGKATANFALYRNEYEDIQQLIFQTIPGGGFASVVQNAGEATVQGVEAEVFLRPAGSFEVRLAAGYTDAGYDEFLADLVGTGTPTDNSDLEFKHTPEFNYSVGLQYTQLLGQTAFLTYFAQLAGQDETFATTANVPGSLLGSRDLVNARISLDLASGKYQLALWGKNLTDEEYVANVLPFFDSFGHVIQYFGQPATYGADFRIRF